MSLSSFLCGFPPPKQKREEREREREMGRAPCCDKANVKKGPWSLEEDSLLKEYIEKYGPGGNWIALPHKAGLKRCGKSCRLRWLNYLRPNIKHGGFSEEEDRIICNLFASIGSRWSIIAAQLPGRTDNDIKNYWNTKLKKKIMGITPSQRQQQHKHQQQQQQQNLQPSFFRSTTPTAPPPSLPKPLVTSLESISIFPEVITTMHQQQQMMESGSLLMFGGDQRSCSSPDGSCTQLSHYDQLIGGIGDQLGFENYLYGGMMNNIEGSQLEKGNRSLMETPSDYAYEETNYNINNLMFNPSNSGCNNGYNLCGDEPSIGTVGTSFTTEGRVTYYY